MTAPSSSNRSSDRREEGPVIHIEAIGYPLPLKMGHVYLALPIAGIFMVIFTLENLIETWVTPASELHEAESAEEVD